MWCFVISYDFITANFPEWNFLESNFFFFNLLFVILWVTDSYKIALAILIAVPNGSTSENWKTIISIIYYCV